MKNILFLISLIFVSNNAWGLILLEPYIGLGFGDTGMEQRLSGTHYDHDGFSFGLQGGAKAGVKILMLEAGVLADYSRFQVEEAREEVDNSILTRSGYDNSISRSTYGVFAGVHVGMFRLWGEYYTDVTGRIEYAENKDNNPYNKNDRIEGDGFGVGAGILAMDRLGVSVVYRNMTFDKATLDGEKFDLPSATRTKYHMRDIMLQLALQFDLL